MSNPGNHFWLISLTYWDYFEDLWQNYWCKNIFEKSFYLYKLINILTKFEQLNIRLRLSYSFLTKFYWEKMLSDSPLVKLLHKKWSFCSWKSSLIDSSVTSSLFTWSARKIILGKYLALGLTSKSFSGNISVVSLMNK